MIKPWRLTENLIAMAELQQSPQDKHQKTGVSRSKKLSTRVDLTPMVDLGFLLITFFIFTTSLSEPKAMGLVLPKESDNPNIIPGGKTLNLILGENNKVYYYHGDKVGEMNCTNFSAKGLRNVIAAKKYEVKNRYGNEKEIIILIHPSNACSYQNIVDVLDEMMITDIKKYVLMDDKAANEALLSAVKTPC
jgi:biopolymer transport protein ExbD